MKNLTTAFIGSGNVAWHLAPALDNTEFSVKEVYSPNGRHAAALAARLYNAAVKESLDFSESDAGIFIIAVTDDAIEAVVGEIVLPQDAVLVHTSGSQPLSILAYSGTPNTGVFYPLQTFSKSRKVDFQEIPFFIEGENKETEKLLVEMGRSISRKVIKTTTESRRALHLAAVFASNFTNHMLSIASDITLRHDLDFDHFKPLIVETISKSLSLGPKASQTGPARRGDLEILDRHMDFLKYDEALAEIYKVISQHIVDEYQG